MTVDGSMQQRVSTALLIFAAIIALAAASFSAMWLTGTLGVSAKTANSIATAVEVGSWGMFLASIAATGGLVGAAMWGFLRMLVKKSGKAAVVA